MESILGSNNLLTFSGFFKSFRYKGQENGRHETGTYYILPSLTSSENGQNAADDRNANTIRSKWGSHIFNPG